MSRITHTLRCGWHRCQHIAHSPHRHTVLAHVMELGGAGFAIVQVDVIAHLLLLSGAALALIIAFLEIE